MSGLLQDYVAAQADRRPDAVAIGGPARLTYGRLQEASARLAGTLRESGCRPGDRVALLLPHAPIAVIGLLAAYRAGCVAVPLEAEGPAARLVRALDACRPTCLLGAGRAADLLDELAAINPTALPRSIGWLDDEPVDGRAFVPGFALADARRQPPVAGVDRSPGDAAHILFTSGSTGTPKGIVITHANARHFVDWGVRHFAIGAGDRNSGHTRLHFDLAIFDLFGTFAAGASLHMVPPELSLLPQQLAAFMRRERLTQWFSVPSVLGYLRRFDVVRHGDFAEIRRVLWCGEVLPTPTLTYWMQRLPHARFTNLYGPTEATIASSHYTVPVVPPDAASEIPIGVPCTGEELLLLDGDLQPVPPGAIGELYIGGPGLSPGYWHDPERTAAAFVPHPRRPGVRLYRTGDLARRDERGLLYFVGRADTQIKSRGYRIELGEIELALSSLGLVSECAVVPLQTGGFEGVRICCAYVPFPGGDTSVQRIKDELREQLPAYMLPSRWLALDRLPTNSNGKTDRPAIVRAFSAGERAGDASAAA